MTSHGNLKEQLQTHLSHVARLRDPYFSTGNYFYVRQYIRQQLEQWGNVEIDEFEISGKIHQNFVLNLPHPKAHKNPQIPINLIGAHYDAVPGTPGADDNATGVAVLLELARLLSAKTTKLPVRLVAFDLEEYGLLGSQHYAAALKQQKQRIQLMLSLEMLGYFDSTPGSQNYPAKLGYFYPNRGNFLALIGNVFTIPEMLNLSRHIKKAGVPCEWLPAGIKGNFLRTTRLSDHAPFWDQGYRAIMVTDTAFMRNPHYHQPSDKIETLNLDYLTHICQGLANWLAR